MLAVSACSVLVRMARRFRHLDVSPPDSSPSGAEIPAAIADVAHKGRRVSSSSSPRWPQVLLIALAQPIASAYDQSELVWPLRVAADRGPRARAWSSSSQAHSSPCAGSQWQFAARDLSKAANEATATIGLVLVVGGADRCSVGPRSRLLAVALIVGALVLIVRLLGRRAIAERRGAPPFAPACAICGCNDGRRWRLRQSSARST